ncbi:hypothetical protein [Ignavibacterium sp.]|uniref:hypothetical protein n=1 Tax=Ignavibacterium sp. TaxID=2651167 RepID=UPI00220B24D3|nr:hypothetical protein [Ignavibacterium sp.]BDQ02775.1 MAG: hypothetical protein KatS3mg037_1350 [Ignavibacterium sp.]
MEISKRNKPQHVVERELRNEADSLMLSEGVKPHWNKTPQDYWESLHLQQDYNKTRYWKKVALKYIMNDPVNFVKYYGLGIAHTLFNLATSDFSVNLGISKGEYINLKAEPNLLNALKKFISGKSTGELLIGSFVILYLLFVYISFIIGFVKLAKSEKKSFLFIAVLFAFYFLLIAGAGGLARFKMPAVPFYIGISAYGFNVIMNYLMRKINKSPNPAK